MRSPIPSHCSFTRYNHAPKRSCVFRRQSIEDWKTWQDRKRWLIEEALETERDEEAKEVRRAE